MKITLLFAMILFGGVTAFAGPKSVSGMDSKVLYNALVDGGVQPTPATHPHVISLDTLECGASANPYSRQAYVSCVVEPNKGTMPCSS